MLIKDTQHPFVVGAKVWVVRHSSFGPGFSAHTDIVAKAHKNGRIVLEGDKAKSSLRTFSVNEYQDKFSGHSSDHNGPSVHLYADYLPFVEQERRRRALGARLKVLQDMVASLKTFSGVEELDTLEKVLNIAEPALGINRITVQLEDGAPV